MDPKNLIQAVRILIEHSRDPGGPPLDEAYKLVAHLNVPDVWLEQLLEGWLDYAKKYKRPLIKELITNGPARFLSKKVFRLIRLSTKAKRICTVCGLEVLPPKINWHTDCWRALEPFTTHGWKQICRAALKRCKLKCEHCLNPLVRRKYQFDHILAVALGGQNVLENVQVLCTSCHNMKTKKDMILIRAARRIP